jgi:hypothetical protein
MQQHMNLNSKMGAENHVKNEARVKNQIWRRIFKKSRAVGLLFLLSIVLTSCFTTRKVPGYTSYSGYFVTELQSVECPQNSREQYGETKIVSVQDSVTKHSYEDNNIDISLWLWPFSKDISLFLTNKTNYSMKIIWEEAACVSVTGESLRVFHGNAQPMTTIVKGGFLSDRVTPVESVYVGSKLGEVHSTTSKTLEEQDLLIERNVGKDIKLLLPIKIEDTTNEYLFTFKIKEFVRSNKIHPESTVEELNGTVFGLLLGAVILLPSIAVLLALPF